MKRAAVALALLGVLVLTGCGESHEQRLEQLRQDGEFKRVCIEEGGRTTSNDFGGLFCEFRDQ